MWYFWDQAIPNFVIFSSFLDPMSFKWMIRTFEEGSMDFSTTLFILKNVSPGYPLNVTVKKKDHFVVT